MSFIRGALAVTALGIFSSNTLPAQGKPMHATGTFEVQLVPQTDTGFDVGRMSIAKEFHGGIEGTSKGMMLGSLDAALKSGGYVAIETIRGTLDGKKGSFVLQHSSTMRRGEAVQSITVVPDSGTEELKGLAGSLVVIIDGKKHFYEFNYTIP